VKITQSTNALVGPVILGGGLSGSDVSLSLIGDSRPDVLLTAQQGAYMTIVDGNKIPAPPGSADHKSTTVDVSIPLPTGWGNGNNGGSLIPDINGDGRPDFAIRKATSPGAMAVYY
jgi:hypothetical protein